jgi:hypothetical protein
MSARDILSVRIDTRFRPHMNHSKAAVVRGALIAYGVAFFWWYFSRALPADAGGREWAPGGVYMMAIGLALQLLGFAAQWFVRRYEREHGMHDMLAPQVAAVVQLLIDAATVLLFAIATFRSIATVSSSI